MQRDVGHGFHGYNSMAQREAWRDMALAENTIRMDDTSHSSAPFRPQHDALVSESSHSQGPKQDLGPWNANHRGVQFLKQNNPFLTNLGGKGGWVGGEIGMDNINVSTPV